LLPLFARAVVLRDLTVDGAVVAIERTADTNNWTFQTQDEAQEPDGGEPWRVAVSEVRIQEGRLLYRDAPLALALDVDLASIDDQEQAQNPTGGDPYGLAFEFTGKYREAAIEGTGKGGAVLSLRDSTVRYPLMIDARTGKVNARVEGRIGNL